MDQHQEAFREEAYELLAELENSLLELEETPDDKELIARVFRAMHTIKGSGAMFGFDDIAEFTHAVETAFDLIREGKVKVTSKLINVTLSARDQILAMLNAADGGEAADEQQAQQILSSFKELVSFVVEPEEQTTAPISTTTDSVDALTSPEGNATTYRIHFAPVVDIFNNGTNPILLLNELREFGECNVVAHPEAIPCLEDYAPEACYTSWDIILTTSQEINEIKDVFIFVEEDCELDIQIVGEEEPLTDEKVEGKKLGAILVERGEITSEELQKSLGTQKRIGEILTENTGIDKGAIDVALVEQEHVQRIHKKKQQQINTSSIRVETDRLDNLVNLVGELVTVQARLSQKASLQNDAELLLISEEIARLTDDLRDNTMSIRMLPIGTTFNKFRRLVRDLAKELDKEIVMTTDGAETELDKTVIDQLGDPLVHLIRNSIDHGIELPETRVAANKLREGSVHLSAQHSGGHVLIEISDDGAGLDAETIRKKAIDKGLLEADANPSEQEIFALLFAPGFSTAKTVSDVSGRGVGMDVVKRSIENLRGSIEVSSTKGSGTSVILKLPLTLAIIDGLLVKIGEDFYVLPLTTVDECLELGGVEAEQARNRKMINFRGKAHSYINLRERFKVEGDPLAIEKVVITEINGVKIGLAVDQIIGQHQTVIKSVSDVFKEVKGFSGATILGDGTVALILDVNTLLKSGTEKLSNRQ